MEILQSISLKEEANFHDLLKIFQENREKPFHEWLKVDTVFRKSGKQGFLGILSYVKDDKKKFVFKISQYLNFLVQHEFSVMKSLDSLTDFCPHFCRGIGGLITEVDPENSKKENLFFPSKHTIKKEVLLMEYIENGSKFYNYIKSPKVPDNLIFSAIKQVLLAISLAQKKEKFTHYDLHSNNIMIKPCSKDLVFLYVVDEKNQFCVPTHGACPVIIDFGFSFCEKMNENPLWTNLIHTHVGFLSNQYDRIADPKLFMVSVSKELTSIRPGKNSRKLRNITKNIYKNLDIHWDCGWDKGRGSAVDVILDRMENMRKIVKKSKLFSEQDHHCLGLLQSLIILPLQSQKDNLEISLEAFLEEFSKIEKEIGNMFYCMYVLKIIVEIARQIRSDYEKPHSRKHAIDFFRMNFHEKLNECFKFCNPKINHEKLLCSLLCLTRSMENILYEHIHEQTKDKEKMYEKLPFQTPEEVCALVDLNIKDEYIFNKNTEILTIDFIAEKCFVATLTQEEISHINEYRRECRGTELYKLLFRR